MRKHKSVVAVLLAVMMIFTFMPTMAFADVVKDDVIWADDFQSAKTSAGLAVDVVKTFNSDGTTTAEASLNGTKIANSDVHYYDLTGATVVGLGKTYENAKYVALENGNVTLTLVKPAGASAGPSSVNVTFDGTNTAGTPGSTVKGHSWKITYDVDEKLENTETTTAAVKFLFNRTNEADGKTQNNPKMMGTLAEQSVTVYGVTEAAITDSFYEVVNGVKTKVSSATKYYDGKEHVLKIDAKTGYSLEVQKYDASTGSWKAVDAVSYKDAAEQVKYRAVYKKTDVNASGNMEDTVQLNLTVAGSGKKPSYTFTQENAIAILRGGYYELTEEQAATPRNFVEFANGFTSSDVKKVDLDEIGQVFDELYEITVTKNAIDENQQTWTIAKKSGDWDKAFKASKAAHKTLFANYDIDSAVTADDGFAVGNTDTVNVIVTSAVVEDKDDDINFSGVTKKVYSGKKTTKKGVLKAKKTFTVKAVADSGKEVKYSGTSTNSKIKISSTGKVTIKKGLKKGTYTLKVTAKTAAGNGYKAAKATETYKIVIKK